MMFFPSGIGPINPRNTGNPAQAQIGAAIVYADLRVSFLEGLLIIVIANPQLAVRSTRNNPKGILRHVP